jgi:DNA (cytosine-5)-methyltransferase 1
MNDCPKFNVIDVFSGVGGLTLGFREPSGKIGCRFATRLMVDVDPEAREVANRNLPDVPFLVADVHKLSGSDVRRAAGLAPRDPVHVLVGGPPCQGFSWLGKRALDDDRNVHIVDFLRLVKELRPSVGLIENVPLIITSHEGAIIREIVDSLGNFGYASCADVLTASDFGVPQFRKRAFVLAYRADLDMVPEFPRRTHERITQASLMSMVERRLRFEPDKSPYVSVEEAIGDLPPLVAGEGDEFAFYPSTPQSAYQVWARQGSVGIFNHRSRAHSSKYLEKIGVIEEGRRNQDLPDGQRFSDNYYSQAYARLHRHGIAQTVTTYFGNPGSGRFMHYRDLRSITVREAARFQSFPDTFVFDGLQATQMRHVGNAVPPLIARVMRDKIACDLVAAGLEDAPSRLPVPAVVVARETPQEQRSRIMRAVPAKNTSIEVELRKLLWREGLRGYRLHDQRVPGHPDVVFGADRLVVFVDGCFWHGCEKCYREPKSNKPYWQMKVNRNKDRDRRVNAACKEQGWCVVRLWEHEILRTPTRAATKVLRAIDRAKVRIRRKSSRRARGARRRATAYWIDEAQRDGLRHVKSGMASSSDKPSTSGCGRKAVKTKAARKRPGSRTRA